MTKTAAAFAAAAVAVACGGPSFRGAASVQPDREPRGRIEATFAPERCVDERGHSAPAPASRLRLVQSQAREPLLVQTRLGYDSIVVSNRFTAGGDAVWQFLSDDGDGPELLHEVRLTRSGAAGARGSLLIADQFHYSPRGSAFRARPTRAVLRCQLDTPSSVE